MNTLSQKLQARVLSVLTLFSFVITTYATSYVIFSSTIQDAHAANIVVTEGSTPYLFSDMFGWTKASPEDGDAGSTDYGLTVNDDEINGYTWSENGGYISFDGLYGPSLIESGSDLTTFDPNMFEAKVSVNTGHTADIYGYAYSSEMGWLSLNCDQTAYSGGTNTCGSVDYGVNISSAGSFGGYAYAENGAWVSFDGGSGSGAFVLETTWKPNVAPSNSLVLGYGFSGVWVNTSENIYASTTDLDNDDIQASFTVSGMTVAYTGVFVGSQVSSGNNSELTLPALSDGIYTFLATVSDVPSNGAGVFTTNESTYGGSIQIDTTEPASPSLSVSPNNWSTGSVYTVSVTNPSDLSGINQYFYKVGTPTSANDYTSSGSVSSSVGGASTDVDVTIATEDQIVYFWLSDIAGNVGYSDKTSIDLQRDVTAPGLPSYTTTEDVWYDTAPTINLDVTDSHDLGVVSYAIDGTGSWTQITDLSGSDETTTNLDLDLTADFGALSNAFHTVYFKITDEAGNETITTTEQSFVFGKQYDESNIVDVVISDSATTPSDNTDIATINPSITLTQQSDISLYAYATDAYGNYWDITNTGSWAVTTANTNTPAPSLIDGLYGAGGAEGGNLADTLTYTYEALSDTQTVTVTPGELSSITILTADNNGGEAFSSHTMTTDDTVTLYVAGYNASGSYWGAPSVSWSSDFSGLHGTDSVVTNGSLFSFEPTKVQSGTISVSHSGGTFTDTIDGTITVNIGALDHVHIFEESVDPWTLSEFGSTGITADQSIALKSAGFDSDNNFIDYESVDWSASAVIGSSFSVVSGTGTVFNGTISDQGVGIITADHATATDDTTGNITVADGAVSQIRVQSSDQNSALTNSTNYYGLSIPQLDTVDMDTDTAVSFYSNAYDSDNNYISSIDTDWVLDSGNLESQEPEYIFETGNEFAFDADVANKSGILRSETGALSDLTNTITVNPGSLDNVKILVGTSGGGTELGIHSMDTDQSTSLVLHAAGYDADDNYRGTDESVTWTMVDSLGNENNRGNFGSSDADTQTSSVAVSVEFFADITTGSGLFIKAAHATATDDTTGGITITDGVLASIALESPSGTGVVAGNDLDLHAVGYDADGNIKPSLDDGNTSDILFSWSILGDQAYESINNTGLFTAGESGTRTVQATQDGVTQTLDIVVTPAALNSISITPVDATVAQSDSITFTTEGFDQYGNTRGDYTSSASYVTTTDSSGSWASNVYTASANDVGNIYVVRTAVDSFTSDTSLSITNGVLDYVLIEDAPSEDGSEIASLTGYTADDTVTLYAVGYTSANDYWGNVPVTWTVTDSAGEFSSNGGNSTTFSFNSTGTYTITATPASVTADSVSTVSVDHGTIVSMDIIPSSTGVIAGTSVAYTATAQDNNGNTWDITDTASYVLSDLSAGHWTSTGTVLMEKSGLYTVTSSLSGISDTATITVDHAAVTSTGLTLTPSSASTDADTSFQYTLNANDAYGNTWDVWTDVNTKYYISATGAVASSTLTGALTATGYQLVSNTIDPQLVGDYVITAEYNGSSVTGALAIAHGNMVSLALSGSTGATADDTVTYSVTASDANGNTWDVTDSSTFDADGAGVFNTNVLSANTVGSYTGVSATYGGETATAALVVYHGIATSVDLSGHASMNATIDASTAATGAYVLVASDTDGNTWDVTASGSFVVNDANAGSFANNVFTADTAGNYTVTAQYTNALSSVESDSLALTINPGATVASVSITPSSATIAQTQSYQYEITAYDANGNVNETNITDGGTWSLFVDSTDGESSSIVSGLLTAGSTTNTGGVVVTLSGSYAGYNATATGIVTAGALDHIFIQDTDAVSTQLTAQSINTDDTITLYSVGYSDTGSTTKYGDVAVDWIVTPSDLGSFIISEGSSTVFVPAKVGTGTVTLVDSDASTNAESGAMLDITVTAGLLSPTDLTLVASGTGSLDLTWTDNSGTETEYIWNNVTTGQTGSLLADATTHTISGLDSNTQYSVRVASYSVEQGYKYSAFASKYTEASAPHTLTSSVVSGNIQLSWDANNNPNDTRYGVYRDQDGSGMVAVQDFTNNLTFTSYTDTDINPASAYDYYVVAYNGDSLETGTSNTVSEVLNVYPDLVSNISFVNEDAIMDGYVATGSFTSEFALSDTNNGDQLQYRIQIADTTDFGNILVDYTSGYQTQGTGSFTVGQSAGSGTYNMVSPTTLIDGTYYARVQLSDNFAQSLSTPENITTANVFAVIVDTTSPNAINAGNITLNKNSNILSVTDTISMDDQALQSTTYATVYSGSSVDNNVISGPTLVDINGVIPDVGLGDNQYENVCIVQQDNAGNTTEEVCKTNDITAPSGSVSVTTSDEDHLLGIGDTFDVSFVSNPSENNLSVHTQPEFAGTGHVLVSIGGGVYSASHTVQESVLYTDNDTLTGVSMKDIYGNLSAVYSTGTDITFDTVRPVISSVSFDQAGNTVGVGDQVIVTVTATDDTGYDFPSTISVNGSLATRSGAATVNPATYVYTIAEGNTDVTEVQASSVSLDDTAGNTTNSVTSYTSAIVVDANTPTVSMTFSGANTLVAGVGTGTITPDVTVSQSFGSGDSIAYAWSYTGGNLTGTSSDAILEVDLSSYISSAVETINYSLVATVTDAVNTVTEVFTGLLTVNNYPVITSATGFVATEDTLFSTGFSATDADDETLVYAFTSATLTSAVMSGSVLSVTPDNSLVGTQTGMLSVTDEKGGVTSQEISLVVANVNDAPVIETDNSPVNAQQGADISFVVEMSDDDMIHGDTLAFVLTGATADDSDTTIGTAVLTGTTATSAIVSWIPQEEDIYTGLIFDTQQENKFTIEVTDNSGSVVTKEFTVLVQGTNDIPVINSVVVDAIHADTLAVSVDAYDPDLGGTASIDLAEYTLMSGATVVANGSLAGTGTYTFDTSAIAYQTGLVVEAQVFDAIGSGSLVATSSAIVVDNTDPTSGTVTLSGSSAANSFVITAVEGTDNHAYSGSILVYGQSGSTLTHTSALVFGNTISGLLANTWYEVKQYDYDTAGNSSSTSAFIKTNALPVASNISIFGSGATATGGVITTNDDVYFSYNYSDIDAQTESGTVYSLVLNGDVIAGPVPSITASDVVQLAYSGELAAGDTIKVQVTPKDSVDAGVVYASKSYLVYPYTTEESEEVILEVDVATGSVVELPEETETGTTIVTSDDVQVPNTGSTVGTLTTNIELVYEEGDDSIPEAQTVLTVETEVFEVVAQDASGSDILSIYTGVILAPTPVEATATQVAVADTVLDKDIKVVYSVGAEDKSLVFSGSEVEMTFEIPAGTTNSSIYYFDEDTQQWSQEGITIVSTTSTTITFTTNHMTDYSVMSDKVVSVVTTSSSSGGGGGGWSSYIYSLFTETGEESSTDESAIDDIVAQEEIESVVEESVAPQTAGGTDSVEVVETTIVNEEKIVAQLEEDELAEISALAQALQTASVPVEYYTVQSGDTLSSIAYQYDVSWKQIADYNGLEDPSLIFQGNQLAFSADMVANKKEMEVSRDAMTELQQEEDKAIELARIEQDMKEEQERKEQERQLALEKAKVEAEKLEQELAQREQEVEMTKEALESNQEVSMETVVEAMDTEEQEGFVTRLWTHIKNFFASLFGF